MSYQGITFSCLYSAVTFFAWPAKDFFKIIGAFLFGAVASTFFIWIAELINAAVLFHMSRRLGQDFVESRTKGKWINFSNKVDKIGFGDLLALRAIILVPFRFSDLGFGLSKISFRKYFAAVALGSPIRILMVQFFLVILGDSISGNPILMANILIEYLFTHPNVFGILFIFSLIYLIATVILIFRLKRILFSEQKAT